MSREIEYGQSSRIVDLGPNHQSVVPIAQDVAIQRGTMVAETMFHIAAIRSLRGPEDGSLVHCAAAHVQSTTAKDGQQAAHLLPGQILIAGKPVWGLATTGDRAMISRVRALELQTRMCFAATNVLPALFNRADSEAEGTGRPCAAETLKPLFGQVVQEMWRSARVARPLTIDRQAVLQALQSWFVRISAVYADASRRKAERGRSEEALVLSTYGESFRVANAARFVAARAPQISQRYPFLS